MTSNPGRDDDVDVDVDVDVDADVDEDEDEDDGHGHGHGHVLRATRKPQHHIQFIREATATVSITATAIHVRPRAPLYSKIGSKL